jgi:Ca2+-binding EF-hand superfamily protein
VGRIIREQLESRRGVRIPQLGTFSFDAPGTAAGFLVAQDFAKRYGLVQRGAPAFGTTATEGLNLSLVANAANMDRNDTDRIMKALISTLGSAVQSGRRVLLTVHKVGEIVIGDGSIRFNILPEFSSKLGSLPKPKASEPRMQTSRPRGGAPVWDTIGNAGVGGAGYNVAAHTAPAEVMAIKKSKKIAKSKTSTVGKRPGPTRPYANPITGEGEETTEGGRKMKMWNVGRDRNPILQDEETEADEYEEEEPEIEVVQDARSVPGGWGSPAPSPGRRLNAQIPPATGQKSDFFRQSPVVNNHQKSAPQPVLKSKMDQARPSSSASSRSAQQPSRPNRGNGAALGSALGNMTAMKASIVADPREVAAAAIGARDIVEKLRAKIVERGGANGIRSLSKILSIMDDSGDHRLSRDELMYGLRDYGINLTPSELQQVFVAFDRDRNGFIDITEFLIGIRGELSDRRKRMVKMAFDILDKDGSGTVTVDDLVDRYDVTSNPAVKAGKMTRDQALREFLSNWDRLEQDGVVTLEEFEDYYKEISASIDGDDYFELMIRNAWRIAGGEGMAANTANRRVLVTNKDGSQSVVGLRNELGLRPGDREGIRARLAEQGVEAADIALYGGVDNTTKARRVFIRRRVYLELRIDNNIFLGIQRTSRR